MTTRTLALLVVACSLALLLLLQVSRTGSLQGMQEAMVKAIHDGQLHTQAEREADLAEMRAADEAAARGRMALQDELARLKRLMQPCPQQQDRMSFRWSE